MRVIATCRGYIRCEREILNTLYSNIKMDAIPSTIALDVNLYIYLLFSITVFHRYKCRNARSTTFQFLFGFDSFFSATISSVMFPTILRHGNDSTNVKKSSGSEAEQGRPIASCTTS